MNCPHENKCCQIPVNEVKTLLPARAGHLDCLKISYQTHGEFERYTATAAAGYGSLECLQFCYENGCRWDIDTMAFAGRSGKVDCIQYLVEKGCPWHSDVLHTTVENGHVECVRFLLDKGCPSGSGVIVTEKASSYGHLDCLELLVERGFEITPYHIVSAGKNGHLDCVRYILEKGFNHPQLFEYLNVYAHKIDLDDPFWRDLLFKDDLRGYPKLRDYVYKKKLEVIELEEGSCFLYESNRIPKDVVQYVLCKYF